MGHKKNDIANTGGRITETRGMILSHESGQMLMTKRPLVSSGASKLSRKGLARPLGSP